MPIPVMLEDVLLLLVICLAAHVIKRIQQKPAGAAGGIQHDMRAFRVKHFHRESDQFARRKVLTEIAFKKAAHEFLKSHALGVEFGAVKGNAFQMFHTLGKNRRVGVNLLRDHARLPCLLSLIESMDTRGKLLCGFIPAALKGVGAPFTRSRSFSSRCLMKMSLQNSPNAAMGLRRPPSQRVWWHLRIAVRKASRGIAARSCPCAFL